DRRKAERKLQQSEKQMRALAIRLQSVREEESASIAREIHDELGQELTVLKMDLRWIQRRIAKHDTMEESKVILDRLKAMSSEVDSTIESVRKIATKLRPVILDDLGLARAIEWQAQEFKSRTGISVDLSIDRTRIDLGAEPSTAVFRILQEILTNVARHAGADRVTIAVVDTKDRLVMDVHDNGRGITNDEINSPRALGILGMQERAQFCGGELTVRRGRRGGTRVRVSVPLNRQSEGSTVVRSEGKQDI
ncbi:MAG: sensor histidine kinase, partial [bacterium]|nr:sensor histidine kinase [bacterium]